ncbi:MAG: alanine--glyoxylate aminotransferase family protein [Gemmatimonadota bacterium]|nr:alanine--glyoxylate aminotransferase family protein [Gemmatimonadota bacterium]
MHKRLFIPGPTEVLPDIREEMSRPPVGHRSDEATELGERVIRRIQRLLHTKSPVFLSTSSSTGLMEACVRNGSTKRILAVSCGAFGDRWEAIAKMNGLPVDRLEFSWGEAVRPDRVADALSSSDYDAVLLTHNETSTGVMNPLAEIAAVVKEYPEVFLFVDAVSSLAAVDIDFDALGLDGLLAGVQKAVAVPPGFSVMAVSDRAVDRAREVENRGFYFDFVRHYDAFRKRQGVTTPSISHLYALDRQLDRILTETMPVREARHRAMAGRVQQWAREHFELFPEKGTESITLTAVRNTRGIDIARLNEALAERGVVIGNGYGRLKNETFRIAHMGEIRMDDVNELLMWIDEIQGLC